MAYTIISQNNSTTTLSDGVNTITVPSRVNLTSGNFTIVEVNNNMATLEDGDGNVYRDIPCVATLAGEGGGGGSGLPDQTGHSGEFLTTDGTDASWAAVDALPSQTGNAGKFLTTNGTDASWAAISALQNTATGSNSLTVLGTAATSNYSVNIGSATSAGNTSGATVVGGKSKTTAGGQVFGYDNTVNGSGGVIVAQSSTASGNYSCVFGGVLNNATANYAIQIGGWGQTNSDANTLKVANANGNFEIMSADGTIPTARFTTDPSADGTYVPTLTIASGVATRSWSAPSGGLPSQTGNAGKFLTTDGTDASWGDALVNKAKGIGSFVTGDSSTNFYDTAGTSGNIIINGRCSNSANGNIVVGSSASVSSYSENNISFGPFSEVGSGSNTCIALGMRAKIANLTNNAIQLNVSGSSQTNSDSNTFKVANVNGNFEIMSADGTIPAARHAALPAADGTYTLQLVIADGVPTLSWVAA